MSCEQNVFYFGLFLLWVLVGVYFPFIGVLKQSQLKQRVTSGERTSKPQLFLILTFGLLSGKSVRKFLNFTEDHRLIRLMRWRKIKHKYRAHVVWAWFVVWAVATITCENRASHNYFFNDFFSLPSLPKLPCTCPNNSREFLRRKYAKTN